MNNSEETFDLSLFFALSADLHCIAGYDGYFRRVNPAVTALLGYSEAELLERPINSLVHPDDRWITAVTRESLVNGNPLVNFENRYITRSGEIVWLAWTSMPLDQKQLVYAIAKNITHQKKIEADRNALLANLTRINRDLKQLTYTTSHDLRSPVNNLLSVFGLLDITKIQDEETLEFIDILKAATEVLRQNLNRHVDQLRTQDSLNIPLEDLSLQESLESVLKSLRTLIQQSGARIEVDFSAMPSVRFNPAYLESIFLNLISNAIKYAKRDRPPEITIVSSVVEDYGQVVVSDKGLGFELDKVKNKLFGLHQTFHEHSDSKGIGLYLVYNHMSSLGGRIELESRLNEGSSFILSFKRDQETAESPTAVQAPPPEALEPEALKG